MARIIRVAGNQFSGQLEFIHLDGNGALVRQDSMFTGTVGAAGIATSPGKIVFNGTPPLTIQLQDQPLSSWMTDVTGNMRADGFRLYWQTPAKQMGIEQIGLDAAFVFTSKDEYGQMIARYKEMAADKARWMALQASSAAFVEDQFKAYMQDTDKLLESPPDGGGGEIFAKARALYQKETALLAGHQPSEEDATPKAVKLLAMQIDTYRSQAFYIGQRERAMSRYWLGRGAAVSTLIESSPCMDTSPDSLVLGASPACDELATAYDTVRKRMLAVSRALDNVEQPKGSIECIWEASRHTQWPTISIPDHCKKSLAAIESGEAK